jgi:hypothetical protein
LPAQINDRKFLKVASCRQTLGHFRSVCRAIEWTACFVILLYKKPRQSLIPPIVRFVWWFSYWMRKHTPCRNQSPACRNVWGKSYELGECMWVVSFCWKGKGQICQMKLDLHAHLFFTEDLKDSVDAHYRENRRFTINEFHGILSYVSWPVLYEIITVELRCRGICVRWMKVKWQKRLKYWQMPGSQ